MGPKIEVHLGSTFTFFFTKWFVLVHPNIIPAMYNIILATLLSLKTVILLPAHPASFVHKFLFQRVLGCNSIADLSLKIVFRTHKFADGTH